MNRRVDITEDIKRFSVTQDTLSYASSKVNYSMGQNIYILPSDMNLLIKTGTVRYNNNILISDEKFCLGKNKNVNARTATTRRGAANVEEPVISMPKGHPSH